MFKKINIQEKSVVVELKDKGETYKGIAKIHKYAGIASERFSLENLISTTDSNIKKPTKIKAGAVANEGIDVNNGENNVASKNNTPVVTAVNPVLPPATTPALDSTKVVTVEVPRTAPTEVATASDNNAGLIPGSFPSSSNILAFVLTPINVPKVSNKSTNKNEKIITIKLKILISPKLILKHCPNVSPNAEKSILIIPAGNKL